jgi:hypothetical protein
LILTKTYLRGDETSEASAARFTETARHGKKPDYLVRFQLFAQTLAEIVFTEVCRLDASNRKVKFDWRKLCLLLKDSHNDIHKKTILSGDIFAKIKNHLAAIEVFGVQIRGI